MRLIALNIRQGGGARHALLAEFLSSQHPDVVVLTEFTAGNGSRLLLSALRRDGLTTQTATSPPDGRYAVAIASSRHYTSRPLPPLSGADHRLILADFGCLRLIAAYFPQGEAKRPVFQHLRTHGLAALGENGLVIGDLNTGQHWQDEVGQTFACADAFVDLLKAGLVDSWRLRNASAREFTWYAPRMNGNGFRLDHALCTPALDARISCIRYAHECRVNKLTDHSALIVEVLDPA
jgi:exodeoxyribonuclease-3